MIKKKIFRIPLALAAEFEKACTLMGIKEQTAAERAIRDWLQKNMGQASLESYMEQGSARPVVFQSITLQRIQITIVKNELQRLVRVYESCQPELKTDFLKQIQRVLPSAFNLLEETRDPELQELIKQVEALTRAELHLERRSFSVVG